MKLHVGCGVRILKGCVNLDLHRPPEGTKPFDALEPRPFESGSASAVYCEDVIEHFTQPQQYKFFAEAARVLMAVGVLRINCPDALWSIRNWIIKRGILKQGMKVLSFDREPYGKGHHFLPAASYLREVVSLFGFSRADICKKDESGIAAFPADRCPMTVPLRAT